MSARRASASYEPGRISLYVRPYALNSSGLRPADASSPIAPEICESTIQKSPCGVDSTRGARSRSFSGALRVHRSFGGFTCESAEMIRSFAIGRASLGRGLNRPRRRASTGARTEARLERLERVAGAAGGGGDEVGEVAVDLVLPARRLGRVRDRVQLAPDGLQRLEGLLPAAELLRRG